MREVTTGFVTNQTAFANVPIGMVIVQSAASTALSCLLWLPAVANCFPNGAMNFPALSGRIPTSAASLRFNAGDRSIDADNLPTNDGTRRMIPGDLPMDTGNHPAGAANVPMVLVDLPMNAASLRTKAGGPLMTAVAFPTTAVALPLFSARFPTGTDGLFFMADGLRMRFATLPMVAVTVTAGGVCSIFNHAAETMDSDYFPV